MFEDEMDMIFKMAENALANDTLTELMRNCYREVSCYTTDEQTGLKLRMRPDMLSQKKSTIVDIKSCLDSSIRKFKGDIYSYGYSISAAFYMDFIGRENYVFAALEKQPPYQTALYSLCDDMVEYGRQQYRLALDLMKWSIDNHFWCTHNEFEILKDCYITGSLDTFKETLEKSEKITIIY
jgi:hypothetical protein